MRLEQRAQINQATESSNWKQEEMALSAKAFEIPKQLVWKAWLAVRSNRGGAGIDSQSISDFEMRCKGNLYRIWNRVSSGSYFPPDVRGVEIPKASGGTRLLGIPTVSDRVAQAAVKMHIESRLESIFHPDSYGYRPKRSAHDAVKVTRERCWEQKWLLEFDIRAMFDTIPHELIMKAVEKHVPEEWCRLLISRWLKAGIRLPSGEREARTRGTPQGGVISPLLANLFLHYAFDMWMKRSFPGVKWCRYADDGVIHCHTKEQAEHIKSALARRLDACGLSLHEGKTHIVYTGEDLRLREENASRCDHGFKTNAKGISTGWIGYKLHIDTAEGAVPVACVLTSASVHDSAVALPLESMTNARVKSLYTLMDAAYDAVIIREHTEGLGKVAVIDSNPRRGEKLAFDPPKLRRFKGRTEAERINSNLKDDYGGRYVRVRGAAKVMSHLMFGILALTAVRLAILDA